MLHEKIALTTDCLVQVFHLSLLLLHSRQGMMGLSIARQDETETTLTTQEETTQFTSTEINVQKTDDQLPVTQLRVESVTDTVRTSSAHPETLEQLSAMMVDAINSFANAANTASEFLERCAQYFKALRNMNEKGQNSPPNDEERTYRKRSRWSALSTLRVNLSSSQRHSRTKRTETR